MKTLYLLICTFLLTGGLGAQTYFSDDFEGGSLTATNAWELHSVVGTYDWYYDNFSGDNFAEASGYTTSAQDADAWLISPAIDLSTAGATMPVLTFANAGNFLGLDFELYVSTTHTVGAFNAGDWTQITGFTTSGGGFSEVPSGDIDLSAYISTNTYIAFRYLSNPTDGASNWQIDDVLVKEGPTSVPDVSIYDIQFTTGGASSYAGQIVNTAGIVTAVVNNGGDAGYFIQSGSGAFTGVYVDDATNTPARGDSVEITGTVEENFNFTRLTSVTAYNVASIGNAEPAAAMVATGDVNTEDYEGVLVMVSSAECTDPSAGFGQWKVYDGITDTCLVDDIIYSFTPVLGNTYDVTGPVWYSFSEYKILPRDAADINGATLDHTVYNIQYTTDAGGFSPLNGVNVSGVKGIVTAESSGAFNANDRGYWIQDGAGAWHGIFVWDTVNTVNIGDSVLVDGNVNENFNQTIIRNVTSLTILNSGNTLPAAAVIATDSVNQEKYEGVLVQVQNATCTNPSLGFGQWEVNDGSGVVLIDDVIYSYPSPTMSEVYHVTGPVYYTFTEYKILPRAAIDVEVASALSEMNLLSGVYPNPVQEVLNFNTAENGVVELIDITGKVVAKKTVYEGQNQMEVSALASGIYHLRLVGSTTSVKISVH